MQYHFKAYLTTECLKDGKIHNFLDLFDSFLLVSAVVSKPVDCIFPYDFKDAVRKKVRKIIY